MSGTDAIVIGGGPEGLATAAYLARAGARTLLLEARERLGGGLLAPAAPQTLFALDPMASTLGLPALAARDLPLTHLQPGVKPLVLGRDGHAVARFLAGRRDAAGFALFRRETFAAARRLRALWWEAGAVPHDLRHLAAMRTADAFGAFESEALRSAFAFDAMEGGLAPGEAGSWLAFLWRAAQETSGLQGAVALMADGAAALADRLAGTARAAGAELRAGSEVAALLLAGEAVKGVALASGEAVEAPRIFSTLSRRRTLLGLAPTGAAGFDAALALTRDRAASGEAELALTLDATPGFALGPPARFTIAGRLDAMTASVAAASAGRVPEELALEAVPLPGAPLRLQVRLRPAPVRPIEGWDIAGPQLVARALSLFESCAPGLKETVTDIAFAPPRDADPVTPARLVAPWRARVTTPLHGLYLCGPDAEPAPALSLRAARIAARLAMEAA